MVSLHVPLDDTTRNMIGARELGADEADRDPRQHVPGPGRRRGRAATTRSRSGRIAGAGLDVLVDEPPAKDHPLFSLPNVTLTPHSAGPTWENWTARFRNGFDNIQRVAAGARPRWVIPELGLAYARGLDARAPRSAGLGALDGPREEIGDGGPEPVTDLNVPIQREGQRDRVAGVPGLPAEAKVF